MRSPPQDMPSATILRLPVRPRRPSGAATLFELAGALTLAMVVGVSVAAATAPAREELHWLTTYIHARMAGQ